ncbi:mCG141266, partial [Mus musculus]
PPNEDCSLIALANLSDSETTQAAFGRRRSVWEGAPKRGRRTDGDQGELGRSKCGGDPEAAEEGRWVSSPQALLLQKCTENMRGS